MGGGATYGMFWGLLFGVLFFIPVFGMAVGAGLGALFGKIEKTGIDKQFQEQVRDIVKPGTSALFLVVEKVTPDKAVDGARAVRRHRPEVLALQGGRGRAPGRAPRQGGGRLRLGGRPGGALRPGRARRRAAPAVRPPSSHP